MGKHAHTQSVNYFIVQHVATPSRRRSTRATLADVAGVDVRSFVASGVEVGTVAIYKTKAANMHAHGG
jgi:hypothetical protein